MSEEIPELEPAQGAEAAAAEAAVETAPPYKEEEQALFDAVADEVLRIELDKFSGPFEVLLYLIKAQEIDIFDIPIVKVTEQYLRFLDMIKDENLDVAGEFIVMAATLIQIKSKMILPIEIEDEEDEEIEEDDPRLDLVEKLLEYRKFRDLSLRLGDREDETAGWFARNVKPKIEPEEEGEVYLEVSLYDLIKAIRSILRFVTERAAHEVTGEGASVDEKIAYIEDMLVEVESLDWVHLYENCKTRVELVCCLLAILELCRMGRIRAHQHRTYGNIRIFARKPGDGPLPYAVETEEEIEDTAAAPAVAVAAPAEEAGVEFEAALEEQDGGEEGTEVSDEEELDEDEDEFEDEDGEEGEFDEDDEEEEFDDEDDEDEFEDEEEEDGEDGEIDIEDEEETEETEEAEDGTDGKLRTEALAGLEAVPRGNGETPMVHSENPKNGARQGAGRGLLARIGAEVVARLRRFFLAGLSPLLRGRRDLPLGRRGEDLATRLLQRSGFKILERNVVLGRNEVDIIAQEKDTIVFVEVRTRGMVDEASPEDSINFAKQQRIRQAARHYIARHAARNAYYRFDAVAVIIPPQGKPELKHYRDAFQ